jgi:hypothetical protein
MIRKQEEYTMGPEIVYQYVGKHGYDAYEAWQTPEDEIWQSGSLGSKEKELSMIKPLSNRLLCGYGYRLLSLREHESMRAPYVSSSSLYGMKQKGGGVKL